MAKVLTLNGKGYLVEKLGEEVQAIVNTIEEADKRLKQLNTEALFVNLAKETLYGKLAEKYNEEEWAGAEVADAQTQTQTENTKTK